MERPPEVNQLQLSPVESPSSPSSSPLRSSGTSSSPETTARAGSTPSGSGEATTTAGTGSETRTKSSPTPVPRVVKEALRRTATHLSRSLKPNIKEEPQDEIKDYAQTTMNELLGWYGYNDVIHKEDTVNLNLKQFAPNSEKLHRPDGVLRRLPGGSASAPATDGEKSIDKVDHSTVQPITEGGSNSIASKNQTIVAALAVVGQQLKEEQQPDPSDKDVSECTNQPESSPQSSSATPDMDHSASPGAATCGMTPTLTCLWCQKPTGEKPFSLKTDNGGLKVFCSDLCFTLCRRASFKKSKVCDWCKKVKNTVSYVDFQDGEQQLQFCSEQCLNQYKMNIFCKETQNIKSQLSSTITTPTNVSKQIIITPDLWTEQQRLDREAQLGSRTRSTRSLTAEIRHKDDKDLTKRSDHQHKSKVRSEHYSRSERSSGDSHYHAMYSNKHGRLRLDMAPSGDSESFSNQRNLVTISGAESVKHGDKILKSPKREPVYSPIFSRPTSKNSESQSNGPENMTPSSRPSHDRIKLNQSADSLTYVPYPLGTSPSSDLSSTPRSSVNHLLGGSFTSPPTLPASQLLSSLGPGIHPWMFSQLPTSGLPGFGLQGLGQMSGLPQRAPGSSLKMASSPPSPPQPDPNNTDAREPRNTSQSASSSQTTQHGTNLPPRPPFPLPMYPNHSNLMGMWPPSGIPSLLPGAGLMPPMGNMGGMLPPNTLMVPYPVVMPLPIPLPLPIPIPIPCDKEGNPILPSQRTVSSESAPVHIKTIKQEQSDADPINTETLRVSLPYQDVTGNSHACSTTGLDRITCACCQSKPTDEESSKPRLSPPVAHHSPGNYVTSGSTPSVSLSTEVQNDAIDLSKDRGQSKNNSSSASLDLNRNNALRGSPSSSESETSSNSQHFPLAAIGVPRTVDSMYSARRSLILDAPRTHSDRGHHSPGPEKRLFMGGLSKEHTYGKRRCIRPRIRTK